MARQTTDERTSLPVAARRMASHGRFSANTCRIGAVVLALMGAHWEMPARADDAARTSPRERGVTRQAALTPTDEAGALRKEQYAIASQLAKEFPNNFDALRILGFVHSSHGNLDEMFQCWQQCRALEPNRADVYDQLGRYAVQTEKYQEAVAYWHEALKLNPKLPGVNQNIGYALLNLGKADEAVAALGRELEIAPNTSQAHYLLAEAYFQLADFAKAKDNYQSAVRLAPDHKHAYYGLVKSCSRLGQTQEASSYAKEFERLEATAAETDLVVRRQYDDLDEMRQRLAVTCTDAGRLYNQRNRSNEAERLWTRGATVDPDNTDCRHLLASLYEKQGRPADALRQYQELLRLQPTNLEPYQKIGFLQARLGNFSAAESAFRKMMEIVPASGLGHRALAKLYLNTNRQTARAYELAATAVKLEPVADSYFVLGWANAKLGKRPEAIAALQQALRLDPDNSTYRKLYESVQKRK